VTNKRDNAVSVFLPFNKLGTLKLTLSLYLILR